MKTLYALTLYALTLLTLQAQVIINLTLDGNAAHYINGLGVPTVISGAGLGDVSAANVFTAGTPVLGAGSAILYSTNAAGFRVAVGLTIGTDVQAADADLLRLAGITGASGDILYRDATGWTNLAKGANGQVLNLSGGFPAWTPYIYAGPGGSPALSVTSLASDNATNVALVVDTAIIWTNKAALVKFRNNNTDQLSLSGDGGLALGSDSIPFWGGSPVNGLVNLVYRNVTNVSNNLEMFWGVGNGDEAASGILDIYGNTNAMTFEFKVGGIAAGDDISLGVGGGDANLFMQVAGVNRAWLYPSTPSGSGYPAFNVDTSNVLTNGDSLVTFKNAGVQVANLTPSGSLTLSGKTNQLADSGSALTYNGVAIATTITNSFGVHLDGGGLVLATGLAGYSTIVNGGTIQSCIMLADQTGSAVVDIWRCTYGQFDAGSTHPVAGDKITSSAPPTITSAVKSTNALTGWSLTVTNGDVIAWSVTACTNITKLDISVTTTR